MYLWNISYEAKNTAECVRNVLVRLLSWSHLHLQSGLDHIAWSRAVGSRHSGHGTTKKQLPRLESVSLGWVVWIKSENILLDVGVGREVDGTERNVSQHAGRSTFIKTLESKCSDNINGRLLDVRNAFLGHLSNGLTLNLQSDLGDFQRIGEDHLTSTSRRTGQDLPAHGQFAVLAVLGTESSDQIVDGQFDGLFRSHTDQLRQQSGVETNQSFVLEHFTETVTERVCRVENWIQAEWNIICRFAGFDKIVCQDSQHVSGLDGRCNVLLLQELRVPLEKQRCFFFRDCGCNVGSSVLVKFFFRDKMIFAIVFSRGDLLIDGVVESWQVLQQFDKVLRLVERQLGAVRGSRERLDLRKNSLWKPRVEDLVHDVLKFLCVDLVVHGRVFKLLLQTEFRELGNQLRKVARAEFGELVFFEIFSHKLDIGVGFDRLVQVGQDLQKPLGLELLAVVVVGVKVVLEQLEKLEQKFRGGLIGVLDSEKLFGELLEVCLGQITSLLVVGNQIKQTKRVDRKKRSHLR